MKKQLSYVKMQRIWRWVRDVTQNNHFKGMLSEWLRWDSSGKQEKSWHWFVSAIFGFSATGRVFIAFLNSF